MKRAIFIIILILAAVFYGCSTDTTIVVNKYWNGYISGADGSRLKVTINFTGNETQTGSSRALKAGSLMIKGDNFTKTVEFQSPDAEQASNFWVFITKSQNPVYPYGIVSISRDYKDINGQIPVLQALVNFYSTDNIS